MLVEKPLSTNIKDATSLLKLNNKLAILYVKLALKIAFTCLNSLLPDYRLDFLKKYQLIEIEFELLPRKSNNNFDITLLNPNMEISYQFAECEKRINQLIENIIILLFIEKINFFSKYINNHDIYDTLANKITNVLNKLKEESYFNNLELKQKTLQPHEHKRDHSDDLTTIATAINDNKSFGSHIIHQIVSINIKRFNPSQYQNHD